MLERSLHNRAVWCQLFLPLFSLQTHSAYQITNALHFMEEKNYLTTTFSIPSLPIPTYLPQHLSASGPAQPRHPASLWSHHSPRPLNSLFLPPPPSHQHFISPTLKTPTITTNVLSLAAHYTQTLFTALHWC